MDENPNLHFLTYIYSQGNPRFYSSIFMSDFVYILNPKIDVAISNTDYTASHDI